MPSVPATTAAPSSSGSSHVDADVIVVGGGHNGLVCAAYLADAGIDTVLVEARSTVGGCASTEVEFGARFNICNCDHTLVRAMPIAEELGLAEHGLRYLEQTPSFLHLFWDDRPPWLLFHEAERTLDALAATRPGAVDGYRRYLAEAVPAAELTIEMARTRPTVAGFTGRVAGRRARGAATLLRWSRMSALEVMRQFFDDETMIMPLVSTGPTVWGVPPQAPGTGMAALGYAIRHVVHVGRPVGGSGALTDALRGAFEARGGAVRCGGRVERLVVADGAIAGVALADGTVLRSRAVVAACDPRQVLLSWLGETPPAARRLISRWQAAPTHDGYESKVDAVIDTLPRYRALDAIAGQLVGLDALEPTAVISPTLAELADAHELATQGRVAPSPTLLVNVPDVLDPSLRVAGDQHVFSLEALFTPYAIEGGWIDSPEPRRWLERYETLVQPGFLDAVVAMRAMTPDRYEREFAMARGHTPAYAASPLATFVGRNRELSRYRTPIEGLYLTGTDTYPGASIFGASGRNAAAVVTQALATRRGALAARGRRAVRVRRG